MSGGFRIGTAGWSIPKEFSESFTAEGSHLHRYGRVLFCCEINSSFYRSHKSETWDRWASSVPEDFRFSVKAPKAITHDAKLANSKRLLREFIQEIHGLGSKLGPVLFQLPPSLAFNKKINHLFFKELRDLYSGDVVVEPRHESWFEEDAAGLLTRFRIGRVAADPACVPEAALPADYGGPIYFRLHGSPRKYYSSYDASFLSSLASAMSHYSDAWCIFDNTASGAALGNALQLTDRMTRLTGSAKVC